MAWDLTADEVRVLGCLLEKSVTTPDQYPLSLNALTNACNQKSSRNPVTNLDSADVRRAAARLSEKHLLTIDENFKTQVEKFQHRFCNTPFSELQLSSEEYAVICLLLLRGPQTPGELRARSSRLHEFVDNSEVVVCLEGLAGREGVALVVQIPRKPGRKDAEYMHMLSGEVDVAAVATEAAAQATSGGGSSGAPARGARIDELEARVSALEAAVTELRAQLAFAEARLGSR